MKKRLLSGLLAAVMALSLLPAGAAAMDLTDEKATVLAALDIMAGDENGDLDLGRSVTRAEFATMAVRAHTSGRYASATAGVSPYYDVPLSHWASGYVATATQLGLVAGYLDGLFRPDQTITLEEGVTIVLQLLGYTTEDFPGGWPASQMTAYRSLGLDAGMTAVQGQPLTRKDTQQLFYNLLTTRDKSGSYYLNVLEPALQAVDAGGHINALALINDAMEGPVVATAQWQSQLPFSLNANSTLYRNGAQVSAGAIQPQDVLYYSASLRAVWTYSDKVTGTYTAATPSLSSPSSVTVAGRTYTVGSTAAQLALSDVGGARLGDTVTLLLGRDGAVAAVAGGESAASGGSVVGLVTATGTGSYTDANGDRYTSPTVTLTATDGGSYTYPVSSASSFDAGDLVVASTSDSGQTTVTMARASSLSGRVDAGGAKLGGTPFADDVQILDTYESSCLRVYPGRLAGASLSSGDVRYYSTNAAGEIDRLVLDDYTGDLHQYAILTDIQDLSYEMTINVIYTYQVGDQTVTYPSSGVRYPVNSTGPVQIKGSVDGIFPLKSVKLTSAAGDTAWANNQAWTLADDVAVYFYENGDYYAADLSYVTGGDWSLTGYYDDTAANGGRIRTIIAR